MKIEKAASQVPSKRSMKILTDAEVAMLVQENDSQAKAEMARRRKIAMKNAQSQPLDSDSEPSDVEVEAPRRSTRSRRQVQRFNRTSFYVQLKR